MKLQFTRSGGVAGIRWSLALDTKDLSAEEAKRLEKLVDLASFFDRPLPRNASAPPDRFVYRLRIEAGARKKEIEIGEESVPKDLQPLFDHLLNLQQGARGRS